MRIDVEFSQSVQIFSLDFEETMKPVEVDFRDIVMVNQYEIPKEYGRITYDQNKNITVS